MICAAWSPTLRIQSQAYSLGSRIYMLAWSSFQVQSNFFLRRSSNSDWCWWVVTLFIDPVIKKRGRGQMLEVGGHMLSCRHENLHRLQASIASDACFFQHKASRGILEFKSFKCIKLSNTIPGVRPPFFFS